MKTSNSEALSTIVPRSGAPGTLAILRFVRVGTLVKGTRAFDRLALTRNLWRVFVVSVLCTGVLCTGILEGKDKTKELHFSILLLCSTFLCDAFLRQPRLTAAETCHFLLTCLEEGTSVDVGDFSAL